MSAALAELGRSFLKALEELEAAHAAYVKAQHELVVAEANFLEGWNFSAEAADEPNGADAVVVDGRVIVIPEEYFEEPKGKQLVVHTLSKASVGAV